MISLYDSEILDILPENLETKPECVALSYALKRANQRMMEMAKRTSVYAVIDELPENIIDVLAIELRTQYYDESFPLEKKRELVKNTIPWYNKAGTVSAVQEMIDNVFESGIVIEWYENGGDPGTFQISTSARITPELIEKFRKLIENVKNVRSHLSDVIVGNRVDFTLRTAAGVCVHKKIELT